MANLVEFKMKGITTKKEFEAVLTEISNCEFCNNNSFRFHLITYCNDKDISTSIVHVSSNPIIDLKDKLSEMLYCEFCHTSVERISFKIMDKD